MEVKNNKKQHSEPGKRLISRKLVYKLSYQSNALGNLFSCTKVSKDVVFKAVPFPVLSGANNG